MELTKSNKTMTKEYNIYSPTNIALKYSEVHRINQSPGLEGALRLAERAGRVAYRSEDRITDTSYISFIQRMKVMEHLSVLEFATIYLTVPEAAMDKWEYNPYSQITKGIEGSDLHVYYITTNYRVILEKGLEEFMFKYIVKEPTEHHPKRICFEVITSISTSREGNRHRKFSILESSTRYVNFNKDKFDNKVPIIIPSYLYDKYDTPTYAKWVENVDKIGGAYLDAIKDGANPQEARSLLPLSTYTKLYWCAFESDWKHFIDLRSATSAHPDIREIAQFIREQLYTKVL